MTEPTVVVVGGGHVAAAVARGLRRRGHAGPVVLLGDEPVAPYQRPALSKENLTDDAAPTWLLDPTWCAAEGVEVCTSTRVDRLDPGTGRVILGDGGSIPADVVVLATGGRPRRLPGIDGAVVHHLRDLRDADRLRTALQPGRRVGVLGAGFLGTEIAAAARGRGCEVLLLDRDPVLLGRVLGRGIGAAVTDLHRTNGVELRLGQPVGGVQVGPGGVRLDLDGGVEQVDELVVAVGIEPDVAVALRSGLRVGNGVETDRWGRTSNPAVYAAGDVAAHDHARYGRVRVEHADVAAQQGAAIATTVTGTPVAFEDPHWFWTDQYDVNVQGLGLTGVRTDDEVVVRGDLAGRDGSQFWLRDGLVVAAAAIDRGEDVMAARQLVDLGLRVRAADLADDVDLEDLVDRLLDEDADGHEDAAEQREEVTAR